MHRLLCVLAVALLAAAPVHSRRLKFDFPSTPSTPTPPSSECVSSFNAMVQSGSCSTGSSLSQCCAALAQVGDSCLDSIVAGMEQEPTKYADLLSVTKDLRSQCGMGASSSPNPSPSPSATPGTNSSSGPSQQCIDDFNAMVSAGACGQGSSLTQCCPALAAVGDACLDAIVAAMELEPQKYADVAATTQGLRQQCGTAAGPSSGSGTGTSTAPSPAPSTGPSSTPTTQDQCINGILAAFNSNACASASVTDCCASLNSLGPDCLNFFLEFSKADMQVHDAFAAVMQACGGTSASSSPFSAEVTTQAVVRLQTVGTAELAGTPQATRQALLPSELRFEAAATQEARSGFARDMLVEVAA